MDSLDTLEQKIILVLEKFKELKNLHAQTLEELKNAQEKVRNFEQRLNDIQEEKTMMAQKIQALIEKIEEIENL